MNNTAVNIPVQAFVWTYVFSSLRYVTKSGIARSYSNSMFNFWEVVQLFSKAAVPTILYSHLQDEGSNFSHPFQHLLFSVFLTIAILVDVKWCLIVVLICIFLVTNDIEDIFMCLLAICVSSLEKYLFKSFSYFLTGYLSIVEL